MRVDAQGEPGLVRQSILHELKVAGNSPERGGKNDIDESLEQITRDAHSLSGDLAHAPHARQARPDPQGPELADARLRVPAQIAIVVVLDVDEHARAVVVEACPQERV